MEDWPFVDDRELVSFRGIQSCSTCRNFGYATLGQRQVHGACYIKQQRKSAKQMLADHTTSFEDLYSIDPSVLTPAYREQLRLNKRDAAIRELAPEAPTFTFDGQALQRFENWRQEAALRPKAQQAFATSNFTPEQLTPFQRWDQRQKSLAGRQWNAQQRHAEYQKGLMLARRENQLKRQHKPKGRSIGGIKDLND